VGPVKDQHSFQKAWIKIRKDLYRHTQELVLKKIGEDHKDLAKYRKEFEKDFSGKWQPSSREILMQAVNEAPMVLMGDFHALHQSQRAQLRVLNQLQDPQNWILALECLAAEHQTQIDRYLAGKLSEREFLKSVEWKKNWGFPWEHYKPLFHWATENNVKIVAINRNYKKQNYEILEKRDLFAAKKLYECFQANPDKKIFVIYGDLHLAKKHLPDQIENSFGKAFSKKTVRIFQNVETLYFRSIDSLAGSDIDLVSSGHKDFCLLSVPPWVKWQNYLIYLDTTLDSELLDDEGIDFTEPVLKYTEVLAQELKLSFNRDHLSVYTFRDDLLWEKIQNHYPEKEQKWIEKLIEAEQSFYLSAIHAGYLARASVNHASSLAMQFLLFEHSGCGEVLYDMPRQFNALIWRSAITYFGNKIINPKKKTDTVSDLKSHLTSRSPKDSGREALQLALSHKMQELLMLSERKKMTVPRNVRKSSSYILAAHILGGMLGEKLFYGLSQNLLSRETIAAMMKKDDSHPQFDLSYYEMLEIIEAIPAPFKSKKEKL